MADGDTKKDVVPETFEQAAHMTDMQLMAKQQEKLARIALEIDAILIREDVTLGEWGQIVEMFSSRIGHMVAFIKVKSLE